jgi:hypothetical protein
MNIFDELIHDHLERLERAEGYVEYVAHIVFFALMTAAVWFLILVAGFSLLSIFRDWWYSPGGPGAAVVPARMELLPPVADAAVPPARDEQMARAVRRRSRAARDLAPGEPGSSSSNTTERERE